MDAGVPLKAPVSGIAMGLMTEGDKYWVLSDIADAEDFAGDMDFKVCGTERGITALQMDIKIKGLDQAIMEQAMTQAREGRLHILGKMNEALPKAKKEMSAYAPRIVSIKISQDKIRDVIGPGGKMINKIIAETGVSIDIEDDGRVFVTSSDATGMEKAVNWIKELTHEVTAGEVYEGTVVRLEDFGAFINILPGQDGLVHVSEIAWTRTNSPSDALHLGDKVKVVVKEIDSMGRTNLSMKQLIPKPEGYVDQPRFERPQRSGGGFRNNRNDRQR